MSENRESGRPVIRIDHETCILCRKCVRACPVSALAVSEGKIRVSDDCNLCTMCVGACPVGAIRVEMPAVGGRDEGRAQSIWVFVQCEGQSPVQVSLELLGKARELADESGGEVTALLACGSPSSAELLIARGADRVLCSGEAADTDPDAAAAWVVDLASRMQPDILLFGATVFGREAAPAAAARLGTGLTADCTALEIDPETGLLHQTRPAFGGNLMATIMCPDHRPQMATVRAGVFRIGDPDPSREGSVEITAFPESYRPRRLAERIPPSENGGYDITSMEKLVVVGRGIGSKKNLPLMREFAARIGAGLGCSRPLVEAGWCEYSHQVGQTGHAVSPKLLISVGVSGAIQHLAGIAGAETIIAINSDEKAPIFGVADYAVVGDCIEVVKEFLGK